MPAEQAVPTTTTGHPHWRPNLAVCVAGSSTTVVATTLLLPYLPLYVRDLGVRSQTGISMWSGLTYAATFVTAGLTAPPWGRLGDRYGRKSMLVRASLGMAVVTSALGLAQNVGQLLALRRPWSATSGCSPGSGSPWGWHWAG